MSQTWKYGDDDQGCNYQEDENHFPVHQHGDGTWWYYDETWAQELGPFTDEAECRASCKLYGDSL